MTPNSKAYGDSRVLAEQKRHYDKNQFGYKDDHSTSVPLDFCEKGWHPLCCDSTEVAGMSDCILHDRTISLRAEIEAEEACQVKEEAKKRAEEEAKKRAEEEAKKRADEEAKKRAEEEAKKQAEEAKKASLSAFVRLSDVERMVQIDARGWSKSVPLEMPGKAFLKHDFSVMENPLLIMTMVKNPSLIMTMEIKRTNPLPSLRRSLRLVESESARRYDQRYRWEAEQAKGEAEKRRLEKQQRNFRIVGNVVVALLALSALAYFGFTLVR